MKDLIKCDDKMVNAPSHYQTKNGIECIDAIASATDELTGIEAVCVANVIKYIWRFKKKNGLQDLNKCMWYLQYLINNYKNENS